MAFKISDLSDQEIFFGYLSEYLDGDLPSDVVQGYAKVVKSQEQDIQNYQAARGNFQMAMGQIVAAEPLKHKLRNFIQDDRIRETIEAIEIQDIEKSMRTSQIVRRSVLVTGICAIIASVFYVLLPQTSEKINVIEYIGYEAVAMEEDPDGRINLPTTDPEEVKQFVQQIPGLLFKPQILRSLPGWMTEGVSIIDYEVVKVVAVMYKSPERNNEHLHHFMFPGVMSSMPYKGEEADYRGIRYRVYASDKLNLLVWQMSPDMVSVLAGHRSAPELAELARLGTPE